MALQVLFFTTQYTRYMSDSLIFRLSLKLVTHESSLLRSLHVKSYDFRADSCSLGFIVLNFSY
jgi:hypothetical protein